MFKKIQAWTLIALGSFLEIYYYQARFTADGIILPLAVIIAVALTVFLELSVIGRRYWIAMPLIAYSIIATSAGQAFDLGLQTRYHRASDQEQAALASRIDWLDEQIDTIQEQIEATVSSLQDRAVWRTTLARAEELQAEYRTERTELSGRLYELTRDRGVNVYEFYAGLTGWSAEVIQTILQFALSVFIAMMAPFGIVMLPGGPARERVDIGPYIDRWVQTNWIGVRTGKSASILKRDTMQDYLATRGGAIPDPVCDRLEKLCQEKKILDNKRIIIHNETEAINLLRR